MATKKGAKMEPSGPNFEPSWVLGGLGGLGCVLGGLGSVALAVFQNPQNVKIKKNI